MPFSLLFLIVLSVWFTATYYVYYENMRNKKEKSFSVNRRFYGSFSCKYPIDESNKGTELVIKPLSLISIFPFVFMN
jgi:hypothetical protein